MSPHISIKAETVFEFFGFPVTNSFLSTVLVLIGFYFVASFYYREIRKKDRHILFYALHSAFISMYDMLVSVLQKKVKIFYTLLASFFFFILLLNWSELIPGVGSIMIAPQTSYEVISEGSKVPFLRGGTADLNTTLALALVSVFITQIYGFKMLGAKVHLKKYFNFKDPLMIILGPLEIIQESARIISFSFRLYGNIFAGEVLLIIIPFLVPVVFSFIVVPIFFLELFVGFVQALVFVMLSAVFINIATTENH